ncbi:hypothetical protein BDD12DRAFT_883496 [Trichophaea hybrida]|nr:hypothetical protein BDD12DRAFT_883496 [Trichophaea hybrida]
MSNREKKETSQNEETCKKKKESGMSEETCKKKESGMNEEKYKKKENGQETKGIRAKVRWAEEATEMTEGTEKRGRLCPGSQLNRDWCEELMKVFGLSRIMGFLSNEGDMILFSAEGSFYFVTETFSRVVLLSRSVQGALNVLRKCSLPEGLWRPPGPYDVTARNVAP